jgi:hypothetical protein
MNGFMQVLSRRLPVILEFLIAFAIVLLARGSAIFGVVWAQDDFLQTLDPLGDGFIAAQTSMLRAPISLVTLIVTWLGATHPTNGSLWSGLHAGAMVVFGLSLRQLWIPGSSSVYGIITALIFSLYPGLNNHWQYQIVHPSMTVFYSLSAFALISYNKGGWRTFFSIVSIGLALGYQIMFSLLLVAILVFLIARVNQFIFLPSSNALRDSSERRPSLVSALAPVGGLAACFLAGTLAYYLSSRLAISISGADLSSRTNLAGLEDIPAKTSQLIAHLKQLVYGRGDPSIPANVKLIQSALLSLVVGLSVLAVIRKTRNWAITFAYLLAVALSVLAAAIAIRIPTIFFEYSAENSRVLMGASVFWSGIFALSCTIGTVPLKQIGLAIGAILASAYAIITNSVASDFVRINQRELLVGSRIMERLSITPGFEQLKTVVVIGGSNSMLMDLRGRDQIWTTLSSSMATGLLREASGIQIKKPSPPDIENARRVSRAMTVWPSPGSTAIVGDLGVVVLGK